MGLVLGTLLAWPLEAGADGGAYIQFDETHYLPGDSAAGEGYVSIPENQQGLLERGPFAVYVVPPNAWIEEGEPLPGGVIRVGTATIEHEKGTEFEIRVTFTVPDVPGDYYNVQVCNEPCTTAGFRETLSGTISIVQTEREALLLNEQQELYGRNWGLRHELRKARRALEELESNVPGGERVAELNAEVDRLQRELDAATESPIQTNAVIPVVPASDDRPLVEAWALVAIAMAMLVGLVSIVLAIVFSRRATPRFVVPDTIAELDEQSEELAPR
ncbi:MAG: hypothetical protein ACRDHU_02710 [Actinomycetota bacterium]